VLLVDPETGKNSDGTHHDVVGQAKPGTAEFIIEIEQRRSIKVTYCKNT
jgi:hypothetical protein